MVSHEEIATTNFARKPFRTLSLFAYVCVLGVQWWVLASVNGSRKLHAPSWRIAGRHPRQCSMRESSYRQQLCCPLGR